MDKAVKFIEKLNLGKTGLPVEKYVGWSSSEAIEICRKMDGKKIGDDCFLVLSLYGCVELYGILHWAGKELYFMNYQCFIYEEILKYCESIPFNKDVSETVFFVSPDIERFGQIIL